MRSPFFERLDRGPMLVDGAIGTLLYTHGIDYRRCFDALNLSDPALIQNIHRQYIAAGAEVIETNTFGANRFKLALHGLEAQVREINFRGAKIAREAREIAGETIFVAGAVGPTGLALRPGINVSKAEIQAAFREQVEALLEGGVDLLILETFTDVVELTLAVKTAREVCELPLVAQMAFTEEGRTLAGQDPAEVVSTLDDLGVDVIGLNCSIGPQGTLEVLSRMGSLTKRPLSALPSAGFPRLVEGRFIYLSTPQYFAEYARHLVSAGASLVGGCCGTTPQHIEAMSQALRELAGVPARPTVQLAEPRPPAEEAGAAEGPTELAAKLARNQFVISVELDPPRGVNPSKVLQGAAMLKEAGVDCINIGDSPMARVRMSNLAMAYLIQQHTGLEIILHFTSRDRNLMALQSDLIGAHAMGVRNIIALTGDPPSLGDYPNATGVWDVDSIGLIRILKELNQGRDRFGTSIGRPTNFFVACALTPHSEDPEKEKERFRRKLEAGADLVMTQPVYEGWEVDEFLERFGPIPMPVLLGVLPLQSHRHAEFMHNEVPGITISEAVRERMRQAGERGIEEGLAITWELLDQVKGKVNGVYLMPSFGRYEVVGEIVRGLRKRFPKKEEP